MEQTHSIQNYYPVFHLDQSVREDIEHYCSENNLNPNNDSSNSNTKYKRKEKKKREKNK